MTLLHGLKNKAMKVIIQKIPNESQYYFEYLSFKTVLKTLTGTDIIYIAENNIVPETITGLLQIYKLLLIKESEEIEELDLIDYEVVMSAFFKTILKKYLIKPDVWLEVIYIVSGRQFNYNWKNWETTSIEELLALLEVAKKLEKQI
jgi:hypothetical protein